METITQERLERVVLTALEELDSRGASANGITYTLRRLGVHVEPERMRLLLDGLVDAGRLEHPESRTREGNLRAIVVNRYTTRRQP